MAVQIPCSGKSPKRRLSKRSAETESEASAPFQLESDMEDKIQIQKILEHQQSGCMEYITRLVLKINFWSRKRLKNWVNTAVKTTRLGQEMASAPSRMRWLFVPLMISSWLSWGQAIKCRWSSLQIWRTKRCRKCGTFFIFFLMGHLKSTNLCLHSFT